MTQDTFANVFTTDTLQRLFPPERANEFFDALFGDANEGAYDIALGYRGIKGSSLVMELILKERPGHCLACNLTHGLPQVFTRHPIINIKGLVSEINGLLGEDVTCGEWNLGHTEQRDHAHHIIPLTIAITE